MSDSVVVITEPAATIVQVTEQAPTVVTVTDPYVIIGGGGGGGETGPQGPAGPTGATGATGPAGPANLKVQDTNPNLAIPGMWVDTSGGNINIWIETGI